MANNNFFDHWLDLQQRSMSEWLEATKKFQEATMEGDTDKASRAYKEWMEKQQETLNETAKQGGSGNGEGKGDEAPSPQDFLKTQTEHFKKLLEKTGELYKDFPEANVDVPDNLRELQKIQQKWFEAYRDWMNEYTEPFADLIDAFPGKEEGTKRESTEFKDVYLKFLEFWAPVQSALFNGKRNAQNIDTLLDSTKLKELMDVAGDHFYTPAAKYTLELGQEWNRIMKEWGMDYWSTLRQEKDLDLMDPNSWIGQTPMDLSREFFREQRQFLFPYLRIFMAGSKGGDTIERNLKFLETAADHAKKIGEFQYILYQKAQEGTENFIAEVKEELGQGETYDSLLKVFQKWISHLEKVYLDYFYSDEYSSFQAELLNRGLDVRRQMNELTEELLEPTPIMLQKEGDELGERVHNLRRTVRDLQTEVDALRNELKAVKAEKEEAKEANSGPSPSEKRNDSSKTAGKAASNKKGSSSGAQKKSTTRKTKSSTGKGNSKSKGSGS